MLTNACAPLLRDGDYEDTVYILEESGRTFDPDEPDDDRRWVGTAFACAVCSFGDETDPVRIVYPDTLEAITCPGCAHMSEPPHLALMEQDENGRWCLRDVALDSDEEAEDDDVSPAWHRRD